MLQHIVRVCMLRRVRPCRPVDCSLLGSSAIGFPRQEYWSGWPFSSPRDLSNPGIEPMSLVSFSLAGGFFTNCATWEAHVITGMSLRNLTLTEGGSHKCHILYASIMCNVQNRQIYGDGR